MPDTAPIAPPVQSPSIAADPAQIAALPPEQRASLLNTYRRGGFSQSELDRVFGAEAKPAPKIDREAAAQITYDRSFSAGAAAEDYELTGIAGRGASIEDTQEVSKTLRGAFQAMELPRAAAPALSSAIFDALDQRPEGGPELDGWKSDQGRIVTRVLGGTLEQAVADAAHALKRLDPETRQTLHETGVLDSANVIVNLAAQGRRLKAASK
ncbi:MAG TPA: hypothetical protein VMF32_25385 [Xanthobacteraceae bacterium]|nr:hypothetical protein [Xanthobacteraceae bacterium]